MRKYIGLGLFMDKSTLARKRIPCQQISPLILVLQKSVTGILRYSSKLNIAVICEEKPKLHPEKME
jgi:hypothetical protein